MKNSADTPAATVRLLAQVGLAMVGCILAGLWLGIKLDAWFGGHGVFIALGTLTGIVAGVSTTGFLLYRSIPWKH